MKFVAVIHTIERKYSETPAQWKPLLRKARKWVGRTVADATPPSGEEWEAWIQRRLEG